MRQIGRDLFAIFYFPLVILTFTLVIENVMGLKPQSSNIGPELIITNGSFDPTQKWGYFNQSLIPGPTAPTLIANQPEKTTVLGTESGEKWIDVNLTTQTLTAYEPNGSVFMQVPISSGLWAPTPTGTFRIWVKLRYALMVGGSKEIGTYYYLPNVPCTQYFYNGFGLHGTYWHHNFGHPMSHGCINMYTPDACRLFEWTSPPISSTENTVRPTADNPGTKVVVHN